MSKLRHHLCKTVRYVFYSVLFSIMATRAYAEVCDKVRPRWDPASGPVNQLGEAYFFFSSFVGLWLLAFTVVALFSQKRWVHMVCSVFLVSIAALLVADWH